MPPASSDSSNRELCLIAHNIRSLWNVGSFFRTADIFQVSHVYLTGYTAVPPRREISKTALGAEEWIDWSYVQEPLEVVTNLKQAGWHMVALEIADGSTDITEYDAPEKTCLILGHEVTGVPEKLLKQADSVVHIPMHGQKESLNVSVATGIALHELRNR